MLLLYHFLLHQGLKVLLFFYEVAKYLVKDDLKIIVNKIKEYL